MVYSALHRLNLVRMAISESQLERWSNQGAVDSSKKTHESIRNALSGYQWPREFSYDVYLQGSYKNSTNTRGNSDVDVVAELTSSFRRDLSQLSEHQLRAYQSYFTTATHGWEEFRDHIERALVAYYGRSNVEPKKKCIQVTTPYLPADVLVCQAYRNYRRSSTTRPQDFLYVPGIIFYVASEQRWVINYPKPHYNNGVQKNADTSEWYKPSVRCFKNARRELVNREVIREDLAPSYFVECLLYNVPADRYGRSFVDTFGSVLRYLESVDISSFVCQNEQVWLFGSTPEQWSEQQAKQMIGAWNHLWRS